MMAGLSPFIWITGGVSRASFKQQLHARFVEVSGRFCRAVLTLQDLHVVITTHISWRATERRGIAGYRALPLGEGQLRVDGVAKGVVIIGES